METSDSVDLHSSLSRQASTEVVSTEKETPVQSLTITNQVEVGVFSEGINCCKWSRNGKQFAAGGGEGMLTVYNFDGDSHESSLYASFSCGNEILSLDWGYPTTESNRDLIVYGTQEGGLGVMNATANTALFETTLPGVLAVVSVAFSPLMTSYCAATLGGSTPLSFWDLATNKMVVDGAALGAGVRVNCLEYLSSGAGLYCGCADGHIRLFDVRSNRVVSNEQVSTGQISGMRVLVTPEEGAVMFCCSTDGVVREFDCRSMSKISLKCNVESPSRNCICEYPLRKSVTTTAVPRADINYSPALRLLAVAANHQEGLAIFNRGQSAQIYSDAVVNHLSYSVDLNVDQSTIIAGTTDCALEMLRFTTLWIVCSRKQRKWGAEERCEGSIGRKCRCLAVW